MCLRALLCPNQILDAFDLFHLSEPPIRRVSMTLKVLIVDNERRDRTSLIAMCQQRDDVQIVGEAESGIAALRAAEELCPEVMLF